GARYARHRSARRQTGVLRHLSPAGGYCVARRRVARAESAHRPDGAQEMTALLSLDGVSKRFRGLVAVDRLGFEVEQGGIFAVIGPNGAGKTTLFNMMAAVVPPDSGSIAFANERIDGLAPDQICRRGIGRTFQI